MTPLLCFPFDVKVMEVLRLLQLQQIKHILISNFWYFLVEHSMSSAQGCPQVSDDVIYIYTTMICANSNVICFQS